MVDRIEEIRERWDPGFPPCPGASPHWECPGEEDVPRLLAEVDRLREERGRACDALGLRHGDDLAAGIAAAKLDPQVCQAERAKEAEAEVDRLSTLGGRHIDEKHEARGLARRQQERAEKAEAKAARLRAVVSAARLVMSTETPFDYANGAVALDTALRALDESEGG